MPGQLLPLYSFSAYICTSAGSPELVEQLKLGPLAQDTSRPGLAELQLQRPLISFDLETTGFCRAGEYIVEIAAIKLFPNGHQEQLSTLVKPPKSIPPGATKVTPPRTLKQCTCSTPACSLPISTPHQVPAPRLQVHGITDRACADAPSFAALAQQLHAFFDGSDLAGHNIVAFDVPFLAMEFKDCGIAFPAISTRLLDTLLVRPCANSPKPVSRRTCLIERVAHCCAGVPRPPSRQHAGRGTDALLRQEHH